MFAVTLCSGSAGNAVLVGGEQGYVLIDAGLSYRRLCAALTQFSLEAGQISAVLITHEHGDHVSGLPTFYKRTRVPVYASAGTAMELQRTMPEVAVTPFTAGAELMLGAGLVKTFSTPHDAADSVGYVIKAGAAQVGVCTDLGHMPEKALDILCGVDYLILEANHDVDMLKWGPYPSYLKRRILGQYGHLSNEACAEAAYRVASSGAKRITLAHLSEENNTLDVALGTVAYRLREFQVSLDAAPRFEPGAAFCGPA